MTKCIHFARVHKNPHRFDLEWVCLMCGHEGSGPPADDEFSYEAIAAAFKAQPSAEAGQ